MTVFQHLPPNVAQGRLAEVYRSLANGGRFVLTYATGDVDEFLTHQVSHETMLDWLIATGFKVQLFAVEGLPWSWAVGEK